MWMNDRVAKEKIGQVLASYKVFSSAEREALAEAIAQLTREAYETAKKDALEEMKVYMRTQFRL